MKTQYKKFDSTDQVDEWYHLYNDFFPSDNNKDTDFLNALNCYTGNANTPINRYLRSNMNIQELDYIYDIYQEISVKFANYQIPDNVVVYRYISNSLLKFMCPSYPPRKGMILQDKGFMSTTLIKNSIRDFRSSHYGLNILLEISIPAGTNGIYVGHLESTLPEYEIILAPNTKLRIDSKIPFCNCHFKCTVVK